MFPENEQFLENIFYYLRDGCSDLEMSLPEGGLIDYNDDGAVAYEKFISGKDLLSIHCRGK